MEKLKFDKWYSDVEKAFENFFKLTDAWHESDYQKYWVNNNLSKYGYWNKNK